MAVKVSLDRMIPTGRVAEFINHYLNESYEGDDGGGRLEQFSFDSGVSVRSVWRIRNGRDANVTFTLLDRMLTNLDRQYLWHYLPEDGGFSDCYGDDLPVPAEISEEQYARNLAVTIKRQERRRIRRLIQASEADIAWP